MTSSVTASKHLSLVSPYRVIMTIMALIVTTVPWLADYNETHVFNSHWPPHAKFHNAQTLFTATMSGLLAIWFLWNKGSADDKPIHRLRTAVILLLVYWAPILPSILIPGTDYVDPDYPDRLPKLFGVVINQTMVSVIWLLLVGWLWWKESERLKQTATSENYKIRS